MKEDYGIRFFWSGSSGSTPAASAKDEYSIVSHFLMVWDNIEAVEGTLIPLIDRGIKYGRHENLQTKSAWYGYWIDEDQEFLEGIDADVVGSAFVMENETLFEGSEISLLDVKMPSKDFRDIVQGWLEFLKRTPEPKPTA